MNVTSTMRMNCTSRTPASNHQVLPSQGFTLVEVLIGILILSVINIALYALITTTLKITWETKAKTGAVAIANQYLERARNLPYHSVGIIGGIPSGTLASNATTTLNLIVYTVKTTVIYQDDPFDGTIESDPQDLLPADYKRVRIEVSWPYQLNSVPVVLVSDIAPKGIESEAGGGTLRLSVINASGLPVAQAEVTIINNDVSPPVNFIIAADNYGQVLLPGAPPSVETYLVSATKAGYSTDQTYPIDPMSLPNPIRPPLSVFEGGVTNASFSIDLVSTVTIHTINAEDSACPVTIATPYERQRNYDDASFSIALAPDWWDTAWAYRKKITFDNSAQEENLANVPVLIRLDDTTIDLSDAENAGEDVRFIDSDQATVLAHEIETWDAVSGVAAIWTKVPQIDAGSDSDHIWMYYGSPGAADTQNPSDVWSDGFVAVYHLSSDPGPGGAGDIANSAGSTRQGTAHESMISLDSVTGIAGNAIDFDGIDDVVTIEDDPLLRPGAGPYTLEAWFKVPDRTQFGQIAGKLEAADPARGLTIGISGSLLPGALGESILAGYANDPTAHAQTWLPDNDVADSSWHYAVLYAAGAWGGFFLDGSALAKSVDLGSPDIIHTDPFEIGMAAGTYPLEGSIDEVRISNVARSSDWIAFQHCAIRQSCVSYAKSQGGLNIYVAGDTGSDVTGTGTITRPYQTITRAIEDISDYDGDTIHIKGGIDYHEAVSLMAAHSGSAATPTKLKAWDGTGMPTLVSSSDAIILMGADWILLEDLIVSHPAQAGIRIENDSDDATFQRINILAPGGDGVVVSGDSDRAALSHVLISGSGGSAIVISETSDDALINHATLYQSSQNGISLDSISQPTIRNTIISGANALGIRAINAAGIDSDYNLIFNTASTTVGFNEGINSIYSDPLFVNPTSSDFHLQSIRGFFPYGQADTSAYHSPAIDAGDTSAPYANEPTPNGCRPNMGRYGNTIESSLSISAGAPIPLIPFTFRGSKTIGTNAGGLPVYKYSEDLSTDENGIIEIADIEWDAYWLDVSATTTGYDIAYISPPDPINILPGTTPSVSIGLTTDTAHTFRVTVVDASNIPLSGASVRLAGSGYDTTITTPTHGQAFFSGLLAGSYSLSVSKNGYATYADSIITISGYTKERVVLTTGVEPPPVPTPPNPPTLVGFSNISDTAYQIAWLDNADNEDGYKIYRNTASLKPGSPIATLGINAASYSATTLTCNTQYWWWIESYNTEGTGDDSGTQATAACPAPPAAPTLNSFSNISITAMTVNWNDQASNETGFRIYVNTTGSKPGTPLATLSANTTSYPATGLTCNTLYYWWIEAYNAVGAAEVSGTESTLACGPTLVFSDLFSSTFTTELSNHAPTLGSGWTRLFEVTDGSYNGGNSRLAVIGSSDTLQDNGWCGSSDGALYQTDDVMSGANYEVSVTQVNGDTGDDYSTLAARIQDANNMYAFTWNESDGRLYKRVSGSWTALGAQTSGIADGSTVVLKVSGTTISILDDGVTKRSVTDSTFSSPGRAGVGIGAVTDTSDDCSSQSLDNFAVNLTD